MGVNMTVEQMLRDENDVDIEDLKEKTEEERQ